MPPLADPFAQTAMNVASGPAEDEGAPVQVLVAVVNRSSEECRRESTVRLVALLAELDRLNLGRLYWACAGPEFLVDLASQFHPFPTAEEPGRSPAVSC